MPCQTLAPRHHPQDTRAAENAAIAASELEAKQAQILQAAAQLNSQLDR